MMNQVAAPVSIHVGWIVGSIKSLGCSTHGCVQELNGMQGRLYQSAAWTSHAQELGIVVDQVGVIGGHSNEATIPVSVRDG